jgi:HD-GYP domain-containing protein (c-di-GMP phosphodiesterase class II)
MVIVIYLYQAKASREHEKLQNLFKQTATALANSIDAKDTYTHGHSARVAEYSKKLAQMNRKSDEECEEIYYAALLHDVGKIGISESIITKKGKLTT